MKVSQSTIDAFYDSSRKKTISLHFPQMGIVIKNENINEQGFVLYENLTNGDNFEIIGCISNMFQVTLNNVSENLLYADIYVLINIEGSSESIPLFYGRVEEVILSDDKKSKSLTCYDALYQLKNKNIIDWYSRLSSRLTIKQVRDSLFQYLGIEQEEIELPNDRIIASHPTIKNELNCLDFIKNICQINCAFGLINRNGNFEYRYLNSGEEQSDSYPGLTLIPGRDLFPGSMVDEGDYGDTEEETYVMPYYKSLRYEDYYIKPMSCVIIRDDDKDEGAGIGDPDNKYIIQGNILAYKKSYEEKFTMAENIFYTMAYMEELIFYPFKSLNFALPFVEVGLNNVAFKIYDYYGKKYIARNFFVLNRRMYGNQALFDEFSSEGKEFQNEFLVNVPIEMESEGGMSEQEVEEIVSDYTYSKDNIDERIGAIERILGFTVAGGENITSLNLDGILEETIVKTIREVE